MTEMTDKEFVKKHYHSARVELMHASKTRYFAKLKSVGGSIYVSSEEEGWRKLRKRVEGILRAGESRRANEEAMEKARLKESRRLREEFDKSPPQPIYIGRWSMFGESQSIRIHKQFKEDRMKPNSILLTSNGVRVYRSQLENGIFTPIDETAKAVLETLKTIHEWD